MSEFASTFEGGPTMGLVAEALGVAALGAGAKWLGGNAKGHDAIDAAGQKYEIKHAVHKLARFSAGGPLEPAIAFAERSRKHDPDVKHLLVAFYTTPKDANLRPRSSSSVTWNAAGWHIQTTTLVPEVQIFEVAYDALCRLFVPGFTRKGTPSRGFSVHAREADLEKYRIAADRFPHVL